MEIFKTVDISKFQEMIQKVKGNIRDWRVMGVTIGPEVDGSVMRVAKWVKDYFLAWEGMIFVFNKQEIFALIKCGDKVDMVEAKNELMSGLSEFQCQIMVGKISLEGLSTTEMHLQFLTESQSVFNADFDVRKRREDRQDRIFYIIDDDMFVRGLLRSALARYGRSIEFPDATGIIDRYLEDFPDAVFLDVHLPSASGLEVLNDVLEFDNTAAVVMLSGDTVKDNIIKSKAIGAKWFIAKPFGKAKIDEAIQRCLLPRERD